jgi:transcriptional regulator with XRE-family HTH domain
LVTFAPDEVGRRIAAARIRKGWTQLVFAGEANVSPGSVSRWERGKLPPVRELVRIAQVLGIEVAELVEESPPPLSPGEQLILAEIEKLKVLVREVLATQEAEDDPAWPRTASS